MTAAVVAAVTMLTVAASAVVFLACAEKNREIETVIRNTPPTDTEGVGE